MNTYNYKVCFLNGHTMRYEVFECVATDRKDAIEKMRDKYGRNFEHTVINAFPY